MILIMLSGCKHLSEKILPGREGCQPNNPQLEASLSPEASYNNMVACLKANERRFALHYFAIAGTTTWYDAIVRPGEKILNGIKC